MSCDEKKIKFHLFIYLFRISGKDHLCGGLKNSWQLFAQRNHKVNGKSELFFAVMSYKELRILPYNN